MTLRIEVTLYVNLSLRIEVTLYVNLSRKTAYGEMAARLPSGLGPAAP